MARAFGVGCRNTPAEAEETIDIADGNRPYLT
jgi:hypothetical protein